MANLPTANVTIDAAAGALAGGTGFCVVFGCVERNPDLTPRVFSSVKAMMAQHGYSPAAAYVALHIQDTRKPVIFVGLPSATAGAIGRQNSSGVTGTSVISVAAGTSGVLEEVDAIFVVDTGGTIGTTGIMGRLSLDGGVTYKPVRLGTASSYTIPYVGLVLSFGAGTLVAGDTYSFTTTPPMWDGTGLASARLALADQQKTSRTWLITGDIVNVTQAGYVTTQANAYETSNQRFVLTRVNARDRLPLAAKSKIPKTMTGAPSITFAAAGNTITRATGSFVTDGFQIGDVVTISGTTSNNGSKALTGVSATVLTVASGIVNEGPIGTAVITGSEGLVFASTSVTRSVGSWLSDGFRVGDTVTVSGTASNNWSKVITSLSATVLGIASGGVAETIGSANVTATTGETMAAWVSALDTAFVSVDAQKRIDIGAGRLRKACPVTGWSFRRPVAWAASIREYQYDVHVPTWRKENGPLRDWSMLDANGVIAEYDERTDGGLLAARFTCARTWSNGPNGAFVAQSLTRDTDGSLLSFTHNMAVANVACGIVQSATENFIGKTPQLDASGYMIATERSKLEESVNTQLAIALLQEKVAGQGPRASSARWTANTTDVLNVTDATVNGVLELRVNGTIVNVNTVVKVS